jgi:hypothetical protein
MLHAIHMLKVISSLSFILRGIYYIYACNINAQMHVKAYLIIIASQGVSINVTRHTHVKSYLIIIILGYLLHICM